MRPGPAASSPAGGRGPPGRRGRGPAAGSSSSSISGSVISARAICTRLRSPSLSVPYRRSASVRHAELVEQRAGPDVVEQLVLLAEPADHRLRGGDHHVVHGLVRPGSVGQRRRWTGRSGAAARRCRPCRAARPARAPCRGSGAAGPTPGRAAWSCPRRSGRARPSARPERPARSRADSRSLPSRVTVTASTAIDDVGETTGRRARAAASRGFDTPPIQRTPATLRVRDRSHPAAADVAWPTPLG